MNTLLQIAISLAFGELTWHMLWLSDLVLGDRPTKTNRPVRENRSVDTAAEQPRKQVEPAANAVPRMSYIAA